MKVKKTRSSSSEWNSSWWALNRAMPLFLLITRREVNLLSNCNVLSKCACNWGRKGTINCEPEVPTFKSWPQLLLFHVSNCTLGVQGYTPTENLGHWGYFWNPIRLAVEVIWYMSAIGRDWGEGGSWFIERFKPFLGIASCWLCFLFLQGIPTLLVNYWHQKCLRLLSNWVRTSTSWHYCGPSWIPPRPSTH